MERVTACNINAKGNLLDNEESDCLQCQLYGNLNAAWQARYRNDDVTANSLKMERLLVMAMLWLFGGGMAVWH
jgi:hypothetical protein